MGNEVLILTSCFGDLLTNEYLQYVLPSIKNYSEKYDFDFKLVDERHVFDRAPQWQKMIEVKKEIENYDWVVWFDADVMIMNHEVDIRNYFDNDYNLIIGKDFHFEKYEAPNVNTGVMIWKGGSNKSTKLLDQIYYSNNKFVKNPYKDLHEQDSLNWIINNKPSIAKNVKILEKKDLNRYWFKRSNSILLSDILLNEKDFYPVKAMKMLGGIKNVSKRPIEPVYFQELLKRDFIFKIGDFSVHFAGISNEERSCLYEKFYELIK